MSSVSITYGKANFPQQSMTLAAFVVTAPFQRSLASQKLSKAGAQHSYDAGPSRADGVLISQTLEAPEGTILLVQMGKRIAGRSIADAAILLQVRKEAALISVVGKMPTDARSRLYPERCVFTGRADVLTVDDAIAAGLEIPSGWLSAYMDEEEVEECFTVEEVSPAVSTRKSMKAVTNEAGEVVVMQEETRARRMRVRRT